MNIWLSLNKAITLYAGNEAIVDGEKRFTYAELGRRVANLVRSLDARKIKPGSVVAIAAPNGHEYMETYYACGITGVVLIPLNFRLSAAELSVILADAEAKTLIVHTDFADLVEELIAERADINLVVWIGAGKRPKLKVETAEFENFATAFTGEMPEVPYLPADNLAHLYYTSGTTGRPKGVMLTQGNVTFNALAVVADLRLEEKDAWLHAAPMFHLADAWATFAITWVGGKHVFMPYFKSSQALDAIEQEKITLTVLVPTMLNAMLHEPGVKKRKLSSLRMLLTGGSPIAPETVKQVGTIFGCEYVQLYGMTETSPFLTLSLPKASHADLSPDKQLEVRARTGRAYIGAEVKVVRGDGHEVIWNNMEIGEIVARGPTIFAGYWKQPEATADTVRNGWIHTGDLAVVDKDGYINIVDRKKDMIITGGENVYSTEVEYVLYEHPAIKECAVIGVPDDYWGESVKAIVVLKDKQKAAEQEIIDFAKERLAHYKVPRSIDFLAELPKTGSGKIYKKGLREEYWLEREKQVN